MFLQNAWGIRNAYKHGTPVVDVFESASDGEALSGARGDGIDARAGDGCNIYLYECDPMDECDLSFDIGLIMAPKTAIHQRLHNGCTE
jgi:hypothetical protein